MTAEPTVENEPQQEGVTEPDTAAPDTSEPTAVDVTAATGEFVMVHPDAVEIGPNTRTEVHLDPYFVGDIGARGVRSPIHVRRRASDGVLVLWEGQRRLLAARKNHLPAVRAVIEPEPAPELGDNYDDTEDADDQIARIVDQLGENQHRAGITDAEQVRAHQQLLDLGMSPAKIARRTHTPAKRVRQTTAIAGSHTATEAMASYALDMTQLQVIAEFDDDPEAVEALLAIAENRPYQFEHAAQRLRDQRADQAVHDAAVAELTEQGLTVVDRDDHEDATPLERLRPSADDEAGTVLEGEVHRSCPGHAVEVDVFSGWGQDPVARVTALCLAPAEHGHTWRYDQPAAPAGGGRETTALGEEEQEAQQEAKKAERRRVIANNKAWDSATTVRRDWLTALLARKSAPKDAARYVAAELAQGDHNVRRGFENGNRLACKLVGLGEPAGFYVGRVNPIVEAAETASGARATQLSLAVLLAAFEDGTSRDSWRRPSSADQRYFRRLRDWGYPLSDVEQLVLDPTAGTDLSQDADQTDLDEDQTASAEAADDPDADETGAGAEDDPAAADERDGDDQPADEDGD